MRTRLDEICEEEIAVQPAPASEPEKPMYRRTSFDYVNKIGTQNLVHDQRKGERRKGVCECTHALHQGRICRQFTFNALTLRAETPTCECIAGWIPKWCDRRSGSERRRKGKP
jgi:hypothetical protein